MDSVPTMLHSDWLELVGLVQMDILLFLLIHSVCCSPTPFFGRCCPMGTAIGVYASGVPHQEFPMGAWDHGYTIETTISPVQARRFQSAGYISRGQGMMNGVV